LKLFCHCFAGSRAGNFIPFACPLKTENKPDKWLFCELRVETPFSAGINLFLCGPKTFIRPNDQPPRKRDGCETSENSKHLGAWGVFKGEISAHAFKTEGRSAISPAVALNVTK